MKKNFVEQMGDAPLEKYTAVFTEYQPHTMPFSPYDRRKGEDAIAESGLFYQNGLRLYCDVPIVDMVPVNVESQPPWPEEVKDGYLDYLVCQGENVLMFINLRWIHNEWMGPQGYVYELPAVEATAEQMEEGDVAHILKRLDELLQEGRPLKWKCSAVPLSLEDKARFLSEHLLDVPAHKVSCEDGCVEAWVPTEYGSCMGLITVKSPHGEGTLCSRRTLQDINAVLEESTRDMEAGVKIPLSQRFQALKSGLFSNGIHSAALVRSMMNVPLVDYMEEYQEELEALLDGLPRRCETYGEAAWEVELLLQNREIETYKKAVEMMHILSFPLVTEGKAAIAARWAPRALERKRPQSFSTTMMTITQKGFFQGVELLTKSHYPQWLSGVLKSVYELSDGFTYADLLCHASDMFQKDDGRSYGIQLFYLLLIQPFSLIRENMERR